MVIMSDAPSGVKPASDNGLSLSGVDRPPAWKSSARTPGDPRKPILEALDRYEAAERKAQVIETDAIFGAKVERELAAVRLESADAMADFIAARADAANLLLGLFRAAKGDECLRYAMHLELLDHLQAKFDEIAGQLADLADRLENLELLSVARRGVA